MSWAWCSGYWRIAFVPLRVRLSVVLSSSDGDRGRGVSPGFVFVGVGVPGGQGGVPAAVVMVRMSQPMRRMAVDRRW